MSDHDLSNLCREYEVDQSTAWGQICEQFYARGFAAALSSATPAGGGLTADEESQKARALADKLNGLCVAEFAWPYLNDAATLLRSLANRAASPVPMSDTGAQEELTEAEIVLALNAEFGNAMAYMNYENDIRHARAIERAVHAKLADSPPPQSAPQDAQPESAVTDGQIDALGRRFGISLLLPRGKTQIREFARAVLALAPQASQSAPILNCPKCGVRDGLDLLCVCPKREASQSAPGEAEVWQECDDNGKPIWSDSSFATSRDDLENPRPLYTHPATTHSAPVAGMTEDFRCLHEYVPYGKEERRCVNCQKVDAKEQA